MKMRLRGQSRNRRLVFDLARDLFEGRRLGQHSFRDGLIVKQLPDAVFVAPAKYVVGCFGRLYARRADQRKACEAARVSCCKFGSDPTTKRVRDQMNVVQFLGFEEMEVEQSKVRDRLQPFRIVGLDKSGMFGHAHVIILGKRLKERCPDTEARRAMK